MRHAIAPLLLLAACASVPAQPVPVTGDWGGKHIGLHLTSSAGTLEYDCAAGRITEPLVPNPGGSFAVDGTHTPGHGGPDIEGEVLRVHRVHFTGSVRGDAMRLTGRLDNGVVLGPFALRRGAPPGIFRCL